MTARRMHDDTLETVLQKHQLQIKYDRRLAVVMEHAEYLLDGPPPPHYPHHGANNSLHVIESMSELLYNPNKHLRPEEWYCLRSAAYLHDIGMYLDRIGIQSSHDAEQSVHPTELDEQKKLMRERHANTVYEIISGEQRWAPLIRPRYSASSFAASVSGRVGSFGTTIRNRARTARPIAAQ